MQLDPVSSSEVLDEEGDSDLHILVLDPNPPPSETDVIMEESDLSRAIVDYESFGPFNSNISTGEFDSAVNSIRGKKLHLFCQRRQIMLPSVLLTLLSWISSSASSDALSGALSTPIAKFKLEDNPFSPETYPVDVDMYPSLPSPQGSVPPSVTTPVPHGQILLNGVYYQPVPAPHNMVVAQSVIPQPSIVPIAPAEAPALSTPASMMTELTSDSMVPTEPAEAPMSSTEGATLATPAVAGTKTGSSATRSPSVSSEPKVGFEFAMPKSPPPANRPAKKAKDGRRLRCRTRSSSSTGSTSRQHEEARASITPRGINTSDVPIPTLKRGRGRGRGKIMELTNAPLLISMVQSHLSGITKPKEGLKITIPTVANAMNGTYQPLFPQPSGICLN